MLCVVWCGQDVLGFVSFESKTVLSVLCVEWKILF